MRVLRLAVALPCLAAAAAAADMDVQLLLPKGFGSRLSTLGDVDGDGAAEFAIGAFSGAEMVRVISGKTGKTLWAAAGADAASVPDQDGDGKRDVVVAAAHGSSPEWGQTISGATGKRLGSLPNPVKGLLGGTMAVAALGDADGDGKEDLLFTHVEVGDDDEWSKGARVFVLSIEGKVVAELAGEGVFKDYPRVWGGLRSFVAAPAGDLDGDGKTDIAVAASGGREGGPFKIVSARNKQVAHFKTKGYRDPNEIVPFPDADGDGVTDLLVGDGSGSIGAKDFCGEVRLQSGRDGRTIRVVKGAKENDHLGESVAVIGDVDGDKHADFVAGAPGADRTKDQISTGDVRCYSGRTGKQLWVVKGGPEGKGLGTAVCLTGDRDGDGLADVAAGAPAWFGRGGYVVILSAKTGKEIDRIVP
jgi:hypothetical protein